MSAVWFKILSRIDISMKDIQPRQATLIQKLLTLKKGFKLNCETIGKLCGIK